MKERLTTAINGIRADSKILALDEKSARAEVIDPILERLGWDKFGEEFVREFSVSDGRVDYALLIHDRPKVFIEAKRPNEDLAGRPEDQLLRYSGIRGVPLAVLTNGLNWWFYLPLKEGDAEARRFCQLDIAKQDVSEVCDRLIEFLARENVYSGNAISKAETQLKRLQDARKVDKALPRVWEELTDGPDHLLVELINEKVRGLCGVEAAPERIKGFLEGLGKSGPEVSSLVVRPIPIVQETTQQDNSDGAPDINSAVRRGKKPRTRIVSFTFCGKAFALRYNEKALVKLAEEMYKRHPAEFHKVRSLGGWHLSTDRTLKHTPTPVGDSGLSVYTTISTENSKTKCRELVSLFGYREEDLSFQVRQGT